MMASGRSKYNNILGADYAPLCESMIRAAELNALPMTINMEHVQCYTMQDFADLVAQFEDDTDLRMTGHFFYCDECDELHLVLEIEEFEEGGEEDNKYYLQ